MLFKLNVLYSCQQAALWRLPYTQGWKGQVHTILIFNSHTVPQLSADVLKRMRESEFRDNTNSPSSKDPSSKHLLTRRNLCGAATIT